MAETVIVNFVQWYPVSDGMGCIDWDCDADCAVFTPDGEWTTYKFNSQSDQETVRAMHPGATFLSGDIHVHRSKVDGTGLAELRDRFPEYFNSLTSFYPPRNP